MRLVIRKIRGMRDILPPNSEAVFKYVANVTGSSKTRVTVTASILGKDYFGTLVLSLIHI